jgi:hypothetical protein
MSFPFTVKSIVQYLRSILRAPVQNISSTDEFLVRDGNEIRTFSVADVLQFMRLNVAPGATEANKAVILDTNRAVNEMTITVLRNSLVDLLRKNQNDAVDAGIAAAGRFMRLGSNREVDYLRITDQWIENPVDVVFQNGTSSAHNNSFSLGFETANIRKNPQGLVVFQGGVSIGAGSMADRIITTLPTAYRPRVGARWFRPNKIVTNGTSVTQWWTDTLIEVRSTGEVKLFSPFGIGDIITLDEIAYYV